MPETTTAPTRSSASWAPPGWIPMVDFVEQRPGELELRLLLGSMSLEACVGTGYLPDDEQHARASWLLVLARAWARQREAR